MHVPENEICENEQIFAKAVRDSFESMCIFLMRNSSSNTIHLMDDKINYAFFGRAQIRVQIPHVKVVLN